MNRPKNNDDLTINFDSACIQGNQAILKQNKVIQMFRY